MEVFFSPQVFFHFASLWPHLFYCRFFFHCFQGWRVGNENIYGFYYIYGSITRKRKFSFQVPGGKYYEKHSFAQFGPLWGEAWPGRWLLLCDRLWIGHYESSNPGPEGGMVPQQMSMMLKFPRVFLYHENSFSSNLLYNIWLNKNRVVCLWL